MANNQKIFQIIGEEAQRQQNNIELIASENIVSKDVLKAQGSILTNKYAEGYPGKRYYGGCEFIDEIEQIAIDRAKLLFGAEYANVQPHSGSQANAAAYSAFLNPGEKILGMDLNAGGHLTHGASVNFSGKIYDSVSYGVNKNTEELDYDEILKIAKKERPQMIVAGASAYSRIIDWNKFREIADEVGAYLMVDMAHIAGLVAAGLHPNPVGIADVVTTTTHKTLRGPRGGMILSQEKYAKKLNFAVFPQNQGGPLEHVIAAKAVALGEALEPNFVEYQKQVIRNARAMAEVFESEYNIHVVSNGTDNHLMTIDLSKTDLNGLEAQNLLDSVNITTNKEAIPAEKLSPMKTSGIRIGTPAITTRGFDEEEARKVAKLIIRVINNHKNDQEMSQIRQEVLELTNNNPII